MKKYLDVVIEQGNIGLDGTIIKVEGISIFKKRLPVLLDFNPAAVCGNASICKKEGKLMADIESSRDLSDFYPAIGFQVIKQAGNVFVETKLWSVSVSRMPNTDVSIAPIKQKS